MSIIIDNHFYDDLFEKKQVNCFNKQYMLLFDTIWPCEEHFKDFLLSSDVSLKIEIAKKIYKDLAFANNIFLPSFTILNVLDDQNKDLNDGSKTFTSQDHVIHSINLYILGIYIFFNFKMINSQILKTSQIPNTYDKIKDFVLKWQMFSFYHDVGYFFEDSEVKQKNLDVYSKIHYHFLHYVLVKNIAKAFCFKFFAQTSGIIFDEKTLYNDIGSWYDINDEKLEKKELLENISDYKNSILVEGITNDEELIKLLPLADQLKSLVVVSNENDDVVALIARKGLNIDKFYSKKSLKINDIIVNRIVDFSNKNYQFKFYICEMSNDEFWEKSINEFVVIDDVRSQFPLKSDIHYVMNNCRAKVLAFKLFSWIDSSLPLDFEKEETMYEKNYFECVKTAINLQLSAEIEKELKASSYSSVNYISDTLKNFKSMLTQQRIVDFVKEIQNVANKIYEENFGITHNFIEFYKKTMNELINENFYKVNVEKLNFLNTHSGVKINAFSHDPTNDFQEKLQKRIQELVKDLSLDYDELMAYCPDFAPIDHGIASAAILYQVVSYNYDLRKYCETNSVLALSWDITYQDDKSYLEFCAQFIFSVLLHNIACKKSKSYGLEYCQNIEKNPFSYFSAFCDTIQKWGRPKKVDLSKTNLPTENFLEDDFDINISRDGIIIKCLKKNVNSIKNTIYDSENFLLGISELIKIESF